MESGPNTSRVLEDIMSLEQDFKYNLNLLRVRDMEIERCKAVNQELQNRLNKVLSETKELNKKFIQLQYEYQVLKEERKKDKEAFETRLQMEQDQKRQNLEQAQHIFGNKFRQKNDFLQMISEMKIAEQKYKDLILKNETQISEQGRNLHNFQKKYTNLVEENVTLSNKIKDSNARHIAEICMYKNELEKSSYEIDMLKKEIISVQKDYKAYLNSQNKLVRENNELQVKIITIDKKYKECISENMQLKEELKILKIQFETMKQSHEALLKQSQTLQAGNYEDSYEVLVKQNKILKEIIKSQRNSKKLETEEIPCE